MRAKKSKLPTLHLTELAVRALKPTATTAYYWDTQLPAFGIRVGKRAKAWTIIKDKARERITIGRYPTLTLAEARAEAKRLLIEPNKVKLASLTFKDARERYIEQHPGKVRTKKEVERVLEKHFVPLEKLELSEITDTRFRRSSTS